jgi:hypothetical protein
MRALRVVGLGDDGKVVICESDRGERFQIPADERLRAAARGDITRLGQIAIELESQMRPREIQSRIRAGESVEQVAAAAGVPANRVERFAYPVLLERSRTAELAQRAHPVREDGPDVQELGEVVAQAFAARGQDYSAAAWDSWKGEDGKWVVQLAWTAGRSYNRAHWSFHPGAHGGTVTPLDDHALDLLDPNPNRQLRTVRPVTELAAQALQVERPERVVQPVETPAEEEVAHRQAVGESARRSHGEPEPRTEQDFVQDFELTDEPEEPPAHEPEPPAPPRQPAAAASTTAPPRRPAAPRQPAEEPRPEPRQETRQPAASPRRQTAEPRTAEPRTAEPRTAEPRTAEPRTAEPAETRPEPPTEPETREPAARTRRPAEPPTPAAQPRQPAATDPAGESAAAKEEPPKPARQRKGKKNRPTVPSWEDVLLGTRSNR